MSDTILLSNYLKSLPTVSVTTSYKVLLTDANGNLNLAGNSIAVYENDLDINTITGDKVRLGIFSNINLNGNESLPIKEAGAYISVGGINGRPMQLIGTYMSNRWFARGSNSSAAGAFTDWREFAFLDSNVASANKLTVKQLTNEDLNTLKDANLSIYWAGGGNTVLNKPTGVIAFSLQVFRNDLNARCQILIDYSGNIYKRLWNNSTWSAWKKMLTEDDITSLTARVAALEAKS